MTDRDHPRGPRRRSVAVPSQRTRSTDPARLAAYTVMRAVADGAYANLELPKELRTPKSTATAGPHILPWVVPEERGFSLGVLGAF